MSSGFPIRRLKRLYRSRAEGQKESRTVATTQREMEKVDLEGVRSLGVAEGDQRFV
jgi:hypothetical protein